MNRTALVLTTLFAALPANAAAQADDPATPPPESAASPEQPGAADIVVVGRRGQVKTDVDPLATFDASAIAASGATSIGELLRSIQGVTRSDDGQEPIFLLNAQRVSGYQEIGNLPPEAIDKVEVLPEPVALRYGYPPTRRIVNFITKRHFAQTSVRGLVGTSTRGGANRAEAQADMTRLSGDSRLTLQVQARHTDALRQRDRRVLPDPDVPFDGIGNVTGTLADGEIDPALSALAGRVVTIAPVPATGAASLPAFAAGANAPRLFDLSPYATLAPANDTLHGEAVIADRVGSTLAGSLTLTADHSRDRSIYGPASATLLVPAGNPYSAFSEDVLLRRYLVEGPLLGAKFETTTLHGGGVLRGGWHGWQWDATATFDTQRRRGVSGSFIDTTAANAAIAAGADPYAPLAPALVSDVRLNRTLQVTSGAGAKLVASKRPFRLPAGDATLTATVEAEQTGSRGKTRGPVPSDVSFARTRLEGALAIDLPIASRREEVLGWLGDLSLNGSATARHVGGFGDVSDATAGATWTPIAGVQVLVQYKSSAAVPTLDQLATPQAIALEFPIFDFGTGRSTLVTLLTGGNPDLVPERRRVRTLSVTIKPFAKTELRIGASYDATTIENGVQTIYALTPATLAGLPDLFVRDASGTLTSVAFRPTNIYRERQRSLNLTLNAYGQIGKPKPPATPGGKPPDRPTFWGGLGPTLRFVDEVQLRRGGATLDLLAGDTLTGGTAPRIAGYGYGGLTYLGNGGNFDFYCTGGARVQGAVAASNLRFAPLCKLNLNFSLSLHHFTPREAWTRHLGLKLEIQNVTDARQTVRAGDGNVPYRFQPDLLDPVGRTVALSLRKLF